MKELRGRRVAIVTDHFSPQSSGGVERVVHEIAPRLAAMGAQVSVITALRRHHQPFRDIPGCTVVPLRIHDLSGIVKLQTGVSPAAVMGMGRILTARRIDVVNVHGLHFQTSLGAALAGRGTRRPMVTTSHVAAMDDLPEPSRTLTRIYERSLGRLILRHSDRVIAISPSVRAHLHDDLHVPDSVIDDVPNGIDHGRFHPSEGRRDGMPLILFVGRHMANKGPQVLVAALVELRRRGVAFRAEFLSDGPLRASMERTIRSHGLESDVIFRGHVEDVAQEMRRASIIVRPSFCEGLPLSLMEAMATQLTVVASDVGGNRDLIADGRNGLLVPPGDSGALAGALQRVLGDAALRERLAGEARRDAMAYTWERCANGTAESLAQALAAARR